MLQPLRIEVHCVYVCSACESRTWYTIRELKYRKHLECVCGHSQVLKPIESVEVGYAGKDKRSFDSTGQKPSPTFPLDDFVVSLIALGFKKSEATKLIEQNQHEYDGDEGTFITFLLQQG